MAKQKLECPLGLLKDVWDELEDKFSNKPSVSRLVLCSESRIPESYDLLIIGPHFREYNGNPNKIDEEYYLYTVFAWFTHSGIDTLCFDIAVSQKVGVPIVSNCYLKMLENGFHKNRIKFIDANNNLVSPVYGKLFMSTIVHIEKNIANVDTNVAPGPLSFAPLPNKLPADAPSSATPAASIVTRTISDKHNGFSALAVINSVLFGINVCLALRAYNLIPSGNVLLDTLLPYASFGAALVASSYVKTEDTSANIGYTTSAALLLSVVVQGYNTLQGSSVTSTL